MSDPKIAAVRIAVSGDSAVVCGTGKDQLAANSAAFKEAYEAYAAFEAKYGKADKGIGISLLTGKLAKEACEEQAQQQLASTYFTEAPPVITAFPELEKEVARNGAVLYK